MTAPDIWGVLRSWEQQCRLPEGYSMRQVAGLLEQVADPEERRVAAGRFLRLPGLYLASAGVRFPKELFRLPELRHDVFANRGLVMDWTLSPREWERALFWLLEHDGSPPLEPPDPHWVRTIPPLEWLPGAPLLKADPPVLALGHLYRIGVRGSAILEQASLFPEVCYVRNPHESYGLLELGIPLSQALKATHNEHSWALEWDKAEELLRLFYLRAQP